MRPILALLLCFALSPPAQADEALDQAKARYTAGLTHFNAGRFEQAAKELEAAYALKPIPKFLVDLTRSYLKLGDKAAALRYAQQFLREARLGDTDRPELEQMVKDLAAEVAPATGDNEVPAPTEVPGVEEEEAQTAARRAEPKISRRGFSTMIHTPVDEAMVGRNIPFVAELPAGAEATRVILFYRDAGHSKYSEIELEEQGYAYAGSLPGNKVLSSSIQYYLEARDVTGKIVSLSGNPYAPHIIVVAGGRKPKYRPDLGPEPRYRTWTWALAITGGAFVGAGTTFALLAHDRSSALESAVDDSQATTMPFRWDFEGIRDLEAQGQSFSNLAKAFIVLGTAAAAGAGTLWYLDYRYTHKVETDVTVSKLQLTPFGLQGAF